MKLQSPLTLTLCAVALFAAASALTIAAPKDDAAPAAPEFKLPPGWTAADLEACMAAGTPGKMHEKLLQDVGVWTAKTTMWMAPGAEPVHTESTSTVTPMMDGRYINVAVEGEFPGMGPFRGMGLYGYDNVSQKFTSTWIDNHSTGIMAGTGALSDDGKTLTWTFTCNCPLTKKPTVMRDVETITGPNTKTLESFATDPKSGEVFKMMRMEMTRKPSSERE